MNKFAFSRLSSFRSLLYYLPLLLLAFAVTPDKLRADESEAAVLYEQGLQSFNEEDYRTAAILLKNALQQDPTIVRAHILLGRAYLKEGAGAAAERELVIAARLGADNTLTLPPLARAYMMQRKYKQVIEEIFPSTGDPETDADILVLRGQSHFELGELDFAAQAFEKAAQRNPNDSAAVLGSASVLLRQGKTGAAEAEVTAAIGRNPEDPKAWLMRGSIEQGRGQILAALQHFEKALSLDPKNSAGQLGRLGALMDLGRNQEALEAAEKYRSDYPENPNPIYLHAAILSRLGDSVGSQQALSEAHALLAEMPDEMLELHAPSLMLAGVVAYSLGNMEAAYKHLVRYVELYPPAPRARKLLGAIMMRQGNHEKAIELLAPALELEPTNSRLLVMLGKAYMRSRKHLRAGELFERALRVAPDSMDARVQRAVNWLADGKEAAAVEELSAVFEVQPDLARVGATLVDLYLKQGNPGKAAEAAQRIVDLEPDNLGYRNMLALALASSGRIEEARDALNQILVREPSYTSAEINLAKLDLLQGRSKEAETRYRGMVERNPEELRAMIGLAQALDAQGQTLEAIRWLEKARNSEVEGGDSFRLDASSLLVEMHIRNGAADEALKVAKQAELVAPGDPRVLEAAGKAYVAVDEKTMAHVLYRRLSNDAGYDAKRLFEIARLQFLADDLAGALWSVTKATDARPDFLAGRVKQVELFDAMGRKDKALETARKLVGAMPERPDAHRVLGDVLLRRGDAAAALAAYKKVLELYPSQAAILLVNKAYIALGRKAEAQKLLRRYLETHPGDRAVRSALAEAYLVAGERQQARREYETLVEGGAGKAVHYNNLALIYARDGDARARRYAKRAVELAPNAPAPNDTLGWLLVQTGDLDRGLGYLRKAQVRAAQDPEIRYHIAVALNKLGRTSEAKEELEQALETDRPFTGRGQAEALLQALSLQ